MESIDRWFARRMAYAALDARLAPIVSFDVISYAAGLTRMRFLAFAFATAVASCKANG